MEADFNPFLLSGYKGAAYFCDRENESTQLIRNIRNDVKTTLIAIRRMGKTGLIRHVFDQVEREQIGRCLYVDILPTQTQQELTEVLAGAILRTFPQQSSLGTRFMEFIKGFNPLLSFDPLTGQPEFGFSFQEQKQKEQSLKALFEFLDSLDVKIVMAIDEFQQILSYPERNTEALLRTITQPLKNINFIFSGSNQHLLSMIFNQANRPFFSSTQFLSLLAIEVDAYTAFIARHFNKAGRSISDEAVAFVLDWTRRHTYYTQVVCNRLFGYPSVTLDIAKEECARLIKEQELVYYQYRNLLTGPQWNLLAAIAKEGNVYHPTGGSFIADHKLGTAATVKRSLEALIQKEMIYRNADGSGQYYQVYDCFLSRWLEMY